MPIMDYNDTCDKYATAQTEQEVCMVSGHNITLVAQQIHKLAEHAGHYLQNASHSMVLYEEVQTICEF